MKIAIPVGLIITVVIIVLFVRENNTRRRVNELESKQATLAGAVDA